MQTGSASIVVGLDVAILDGIFNHLFERGGIAREFEHPWGLGTIRLERIGVEVRPGVGPRLALVVEGVLRVPTGQDLPFTVVVQLMMKSVVLYDERPSEGGGPPELVARPPAVGFSFGPFIEAPAGQENLLSVLLAQMLGPVMSNLSLPLFDDFVPRLEAVLYDEHPPSRGSWDAVFWVGGAGTLKHDQISTMGAPVLGVVGTDYLETVPAIMGAIAPPEKTVALPNLDSTVPRGTGIQVIIAKTAMDLLLAARAEEQVGNVVDGATVQATSLQMHPLGIYVSGRAKKSHAKIKWNGILALTFRRWLYRGVGDVQGAAPGSHPSRIDAFDGGGFLSIYADAVQVDVDVPWWVTFLEAVFFLAGPLGWTLNDLLLQPKLDEIASAPGTVRRSIATEIGTPLREMLGRLTGALGIDGVPVSILAHDLWSLGGDFAYNAIGFVGRNERELVDHELDYFRVHGAEGRSVGKVTLDSGHVLSASEAGRMLKEGVLVIDGYHGVEAPYGFYIRSDPNETTSDNLVPPDQIFES